MNSDEPTKVLVVDDDEDDLFLITDALRQVASTRYNITTASSSLAAMGALAVQKFDVIFSDYRLGAVTGVDFINSVRSAGIDTPVILLTGISDSFIDNEALRAGASDFISKTNLDPEVLDRSVRYALAHANRQRLLRSILKNTKSGIAVLDPDGSVNLTNAQLERFAEVAFGAGLDGVKKLIETARNATLSDIVIGPLVLERDITRLPDGNAILTLHDVTDRVNDLRRRAEAEERVRAIAMKDALTGLPNRLAFNANLDACLEEAHASGKKLALLLFDFNRFKEVNDLFGHAAGDQILLLAAKKLRETLGPDEFVARLGGDEFVLIKKDATEASALELAHRIEQNLKLSQKWEDKVVEASITLGVSLFPDHGSDRQQLLGCADLAMYRGKSELERTVCVFDASMDQYVRDRRALSHDLRHAIQEDQLSLDLQPQFHARTLTLAGVEALLRWRSPKRGWVSPAEFIPVAEENGLILELDRWVIRRACSLAARHPRLPRLAVNLSAKAICQLSIVQDVQSALLEFGISPGRIELEITETALVQDLNRALHNLRQIKALGISIAMDDFGIGYSSLSLLNSFPFDRIKVDGSFIRLTGSNPRADAIFRAVVGLGAALNVPVLAEGVETAQQLSFATASRCAEIQGFFLSGPIPESDLDVMRASIAKGLVLPAARIPTAEYAFAALPQNVKRIIG